MIRVKNTAKFTVFRREIYSKLGDIESVFESFGADCIITCGTDSHKADDPHTNGFALDFGTHHIPDDRLKSVHQSLATILGKEYTVLYTDKNLAEAVYVDTDNAHFHIQYRKDLWRKIVYG